MSPTQLDRFSVHHLFVVIARGANAVVHNFNGNCVIAFNLSAVMQLVISSTMLSYVKFCCTKRKARTGEFIQFTPLALGWNNQLLYKMLIHNDSSYGKRNGGEWCVAFFCVYIAVVMFVKQSFILCFYRQPLERHPKIVLCEEHQLCDNRELTEKRTESKKFFHAIQVNVEQEIAHKRKICELFYFLLFEKCARAKRIEIWLQTNLECIHD